MEDGGAQVMLSSWLVIQIPLQQSRLLIHGQSGGRAKTFARELQSQVKFGQQTAAAVFGIEVVGPQVILSSALVMQIPLQQSKLETHTAPIRKENVPGPKELSQVSGLPDCA